MDATSSTVEDHSQQLGELLVMLQMIQDMMGTQQEMVMGLMEWEHQLAIQEVEINQQFPKVIPPSSLHPYPLSPPVVQYYNNIQLLPIVV